MTNRTNHKFSMINGYEQKESTDGNLIIGGYISTTHIDQGFYDETRDLYVKDRVAKETLYDWCDGINSGNARTNKVSVVHNREPIVSGVGIQGTARVDSLPDGHFGLYVDTLVDKTKDDFATTQSRIDNNLYDSFSIEFTTRDVLTGDYLPGAVTEITEGNGIIRTLLPGTLLDGWTMCSQPMNEHAIRLKSLIVLGQEDPNKVKKSKEAINMSEKKTIEKKEEDAQPEGEAPKTEETSQPEEPTVEATIAPIGDSISDEDKKILASAKSKTAQEQKDKEIKAFSEDVMKEVKDKLRSVKIDNKVLNGVEEKGADNEPYMEYKQMITEKRKVSGIEQLKIAARFAESKRWIDGTSVQKRKSDVFSSREGKLRIVENKMEFKLGITSNQNTDTDYLLSAAELQDVFDPVIFNILNQKTTAWNILEKEDNSNKGNNQVQFILKTGANSSAGSYTGNAVNTSDVIRLKYQTQFKKYQAGVEIDGDMMAAAAPSDVFAQEVSDSTDDLMAVMNDELFAENGTEASAGVIGFEYITDQSGNGTLYNLSRTQANGLASSTTSDNYINGSGNDITLGNLRTGKRKAVGVEAAEISNLVYFTSFIQGDKFRGIYDSAQRLVPTSTRVGFEGRPSFDGIPIFEDRSCNDDDWFLVDLETHRIAIWVPPTLEMLGKDSDSQKGFIKTYFATFNRAPRRMVQIYNNKITF